MMKDFHVMPYVEMDGIPTFADSQLRAMYDKIVDEEKGYIFSDGTIPDREAFVKMAKSTDTSFYVVYHVEAPVLIVWLNRFEGAIARMNWCAFNGVSIRTKIKAGRYINKLLTDKVFDLLIGYTPASNEAAIKFIKLCGGNVIGTVPNLIWDDKEKVSKDGVISYYKRGQNEDI